VYRIARELGAMAAELEGLLSAAGLRDVAVRTLPPEPGAKGPGLVVATGRRAPRKS